MECAATQVVVDTVPASKRTRTAWVGSGWLLAWDGFAPGAVVRPLLHMLPADHATAPPPVAAPPLVADVLGHAHLFLPRVEHVVLCGVAAPPEPLRSPGLGVLGTFPPGTIGGWTLQAQNCSYESGTAVFTGNVGRTSALPPASGAQKLWATVLDEAAGGSVVVHVHEFEPAALIPGEPGIEVTCQHELAEGHTLRLRIFDQDPGTTEPTGGLLLWEL